MHRPRPALVAVLIAAVAFARAYGLERYFDDWSLAWVAADAIERGTVGSFIWTPFDQHWSPVWMAFEALNISLAGPLSDSVLRTVVLALVIASLMTLAWFLRRLGVGAPATASGMLVLGWHHLNATAYYSFDCYSQVAVDLLSWAIGSLAIVAVTERDDDRARRRLWFAMLLFLPAPFIKEQALSAIAALAVVAAFAARGGRRALGIGVVAAMSALWGLVFAALRTGAGRSMDADGPYSICVACVPGNVGLLFGGVLLPWRTPDVYLALRAGEPTDLLALTAIGAALLVGALVAGVRAWTFQHGSPRVPALLAALMLSAAFPVAMLSHVGELHAHGLLYWFASLVAVAVEGWGVRVPDRWRGRPLAPGLAALYAVVLLAALQLNLGDMRANGERARRWIARFDHAMAALPPGSLVAVRGLVDVKGPADYSLLRLTTPGLLLRGSTGLLVAGRRDVRIVQVADEGLTPTVREAGWDASRVVVVDVIGNEVLRR